MYYVVFEDIKRGGLSIIHKKILLLLCKSYINEKKTDHNK